MTPRRPRSLAHRITRVPTAFDPDRGREVAAHYGATGALAELLTGAGGSSPYLHRLLLAHREWAEAAFDDPDAALQSLMNPDNLRRDKARLALITGLCDLGGAWSLEDVTGALTDFADAALARALNDALAPMIRSGKLPEEPGLFALAMGKMGARELNYSSDIDLICLFDDTTLADPGGHRAHLIRATRTAMKRLSDVTAEGYVFRTDLRLRPDAAVTPIVLSTSAAEAYYESVGRTWERAAHIKARVAAGDSTAGARYLRDLTPFIWRRHLDFAAVEDAHGMLTRIREHKGLSGPITLPGHDMKLGRGGIREIEFFAQTRQLIAGGRDAGLRAPGTRAALGALTAAGWVKEDTRAALDAAYVSHREVEHRLQMLRDAQTHSLPHSDEGLDRLAAFMGLARADLDDRLTETLETAHALTEPFFAPSAAAKSPQDPAAGFGKDITQRWQTYPALRSERAARLFDRIGPQIMERLARSDDPERALRHFDAFLAGLPAGVQVFALFEANPELVTLLADIAAVAPALAEYLGRNAQVLDAVLDGSFFAPWPGREALTAMLTARLNAVEDYELKLDEARIWVKEWHFRVGVHLLRDLTTAEEAGHQYAELAEATLAALYPVVVANFARRHGLPPGRGATLVAMGSLGAGRLHAASDLDLLVIYDADNVETSEGPKPLATRPYYARFTQALITALSAPTAGGKLYEVDMRLRPSGRNGPLATSLSAFSTYQRNEAWTWEHLALTRARVVAGDASVAAAVEEVRCAVIAQPRDRARVAADVADMRRRILDARPGEGGLAAKDGPGRLQDLELFAQTVALLAGSDAREVAEQLRAGDEASLIPAADLFWNVRAITRLVLKPGSSTQALSGAGQSRLLLRGTNLKTLDALAARLAEDGREAADHVAHRLARWAGAD
ncbi:MAG: glutamine-synthetase adenylyltransferase [Pseudomonadota bacterium]